MKWLMLKSLIFKKGFINYIFVCILLFGTLIFLMNARVSVNKLVEDSKNVIEYRTVIVTVKNDKILEELKQEKMIEKVEKRDELSFNLILKKYDYISPFLEYYSDEFSYIETKPYTSSEVVNGVSKLLISIISLVLIIIIFLTFINVNDLAVSEKKDISLYKLLGYNNKYLLKSLLQILVILHIVLYFFGVILSFIITKVANYFLLIKGIEFNISMFKLHITIKLFLLMIIVLFVCLLILYLKIKKIAPVILFKES